MTEYERAIYTNHNLQHQSQFMPTGNLYASINESRQFQNDTRVINAINHDSIICSQNVNNLKS